VIGAAQSGFHEYIAAELFHRRLSFLSALDIYCNDDRQASRSGLDPKWKGGKLGMSAATHHIARLATLWGESKTTEYVKALAAQQPILGPLGTIYSRLQLGEVLLAITLTDSFVHQAKVAARRSSMPTMSHW
jgi:ABC-type Fe3+ transport system substrate-binding protein